MKDLDISIVDAPEYIDDAESPIEAVTKKTEFLDCRGHDDGENR